MGGGSHNEGDGVQRSLGRLEGNVDNLKDSVDRILETVERSAHESSKQRGQMHSTINDISNKIDPVLIRLDAVEMTVKMHEVVLASYATRDAELKGAARAGWWLMHAFWFIGSSAAVIFSDKIKLPLSRLFR